jgi:hypothetical protein
MNKRISRALPVTALLTLGIAVALASCDDPFAPIDPAVDSPPVVHIQEPGDGMVARVGDSIFVSARVQASRSLHSVEFAAFSLRGSGELGTQEQVARFQTRTVSFQLRSPALRDTVVSRWLRATPDLLADPQAFLVVTARDTAGAVGADTVRFALSSPQVEITSPVEGASVLAPSQLRVAVRASDAVGGVSRVRVVSAGAAAWESTIDFSPALASVDTAVLVTIPPEAQGTLQLQAHVHTAQGHTRASGVVNVVTRDGSPPTVQIVQPTAGFTLAVGDSLFTEVHVTDNQGLASVELTGFALRGDPQLGTQVLVPRFHTKTVELAGAPTDTLITRFLIASGDTLPEDGVYVVATARDTAGNVRADTTRISVRGPRVELVSPVSGSTFPQGTPFPVRIVAQDNFDRIQSIRLTGTGALTVDTTLVLLTPNPAQVDTIIMVAATTSGAATLRAHATSGTNLHTSSRQISLQISPPTVDTQAPAVRYTVVAPERLEVTDSVTVQVTATDNTMVERVGVTLLPLAGPGDTLTVRGASTPGASGTFRFALRDLGVLADINFTLALEVTAFAVDTAAAQNCATSTVPGTFQSAPCVAGTGRLAGHTVSNQAGSRHEIFVARGRTIRTASPSDRIPDLLSDGRNWVFASNLTRNRVEVLAIGDTVIRGHVLVGSEPWGLALSADSSHVLVANSGATNISRFSVTPGQVAGGLAQENLGRLQTPNVLVTDVRFSVEEGSGRLTMTMQEIDYSDRPQFLAQAGSGRVYYSTKPTAAAPDGTIRRFHPDSLAQRGVTVFTDYVRQTLTNQFLIVGGQVSILPGDVGGTVPERLRVCGQVASAPGTEQCFENPEQTGPSTYVFHDWADFEAAIVAADIGVQFRYGLNPAHIGLSDTTFVAVSANRQRVAFGEGVAQFGRVILFDDPTSRILGHSDDLVHNVAERVVGVALNPAGTFGLARGWQTYFFDQNLRLQGLVSTGLPAGGLDVHPHHQDGANQPTGVAFVSGVEGEAPYLDVIDTHHFHSRRRIFLRSPVTGAVRTVPRQAGDPADLALRIYALTAEGIVMVPVFDRDIAP